MVIGRQKCYCAPLFESDGTDDIVQSKQFNDMHIPDDIYVWSEMEMYKCSAGDDYNVILKTYYECGDRRFAIAEHIKLCPFCGKEFNRNIFNPSNRT